MTQDTKKPQRELTEKQKIFLDALMGEARGNIRKAMDIAGYAKESSVASVVNSLKDEMIDRAKNYMAANAMKASMALEDSLDDPNALGTANKLKAAQAILDRAGISGKTEKEGDVNLKVPTGGLFILPAKAKDEGITEGATDDAETVTT